MNTEINKMELAINSKIPFLELIDDGKHHKVLYEDRAFVVGRFLFQIIEQLKEGNLFRAIVDDIYDGDNYGINKEKLQSLLIEKLENFNKRLEAVNSNRRSNYISFKTQIANAEVVGKLASLFTTLYQRKVFISMILIIVFAHLFYTISDPEVLALFSFNELSTQKVIIGYLLALIVLLFHELGHAVAAKAFGVKPKGIGFGFYLIFPVFYTDVTAIWKLDKYKRIVVNLGGVYFQAIVNLFLMCFLYFSVEESIVLNTIFLFLYKVNSAVIIYSLSPYFRNDGYWIYSDLFDIPNLSQKAYAYPKEVFKAFRGRLTTENGVLWLYRNVSKELPLMIFSSTNYLVMAFFFTMLFQFIGISAKEVFHSLIIQQEGLSSDVLLKIVFLCVMVGLLLYRFRGLLTRLLIRNKTKPINNLSNA